MAITTSTSSDGLYRDCSYYTPTINSTAWSLGFWYKAPSVPTGSDKYCIWHYGDVNHINPYAALYFGSTGFYLEVFNGTTTQTSSVASQQSYTADRWIWVSLMELGGTFRFYYNSRQIFTVTLLPSSFTFVEDDEYFGTGYGATLGGHSFGYVRQYSNFSSGTDNSSGRPLSKFLDVDFYYASGLVSDCALRSTADLSDQSGNGHPLSAVGSITTTPVGPLDLVAGVFSDNFNTGVLVDRWTDVPNTAVTSGSFGCDNSPAFGTCWGSGQIWKGFKDQYTEGTIRATIWPQITGEIQLFHVGTIDGTQFAVQAAFQLVVFVHGDGRIRLRNSESTGNVFYDSSVGLIANDGTPYGFQMTWTISGGTVAADVYINDVNVISISGKSMPVGGRQYWTDCSIAILTPAQRIVVDNYEIENVAVYESTLSCSANRIYNCTQIAGPYTPAGGSLLLDGQPISALITFPTNREPLWKLLTYSMKQRKEE